MKVLRKKPGRAICEPEAGSRATSGTLKNWGLGEGREGPSGHRLVEGGPGASR